MLPGSVLPLTTAGRISQRRRRQSRFSAEALEERLLLFALGTRWPSTALSGSGLGQGDPTTVTWGLVDDGTQISANSNIPSESDGPSDLVGWLESVHGVATADGDHTDEPWFQFFSETFDRWEAISGLTFVYEPADDGAPIQTPGSTFPGVSGTRADIRIGGHAIDGNYGILAYAYQPVSGDLILDTTDSVLADGTLDYRKFRQTLAHEVGHSLGLDHMVSTSDEFLMEGGLNSSFLGPQYDDILGIQRWYGDGFEPDQNDDTSSPTSLGLLAAGQSIAVGTDGATVLQQVGENDIVSIDDESDIDVYSFSIAEAGEVTLELTPVGPSYLAGPVSGGQSTFDAAAQSDLALELIDTDGSTVLVSSNESGLGVLESIRDHQLSSAGTYFVRVSGSTADKVQTYQLTLTGPPLPTLTVSVNTDTVSEAAGTAAAVGTVVRSGGDMGTPLIVSLSSSDTTEILLPLSVTIPPHASSMTFLITAIDDLAADGTQLVTLTAVSSGWVTGVASLSVLDDDVPATPSITGPAAVVGSQRPAITWTASSGAESYDLWIANQSTGVNPLYTFTVTTNSWTPSFDLGIGLFNVWVRASNSNGDSSYSVQHNFRINTAVTTSEIDRFQTTHRPSLLWDSLEGADQYDIWIDDFLGGVSQYIRQTDLTTTTFTPSFDMGVGLYRAWVRGIDAGGFAAEWSQTVEIMVVAAPTIAGGDNPTFDRTPTFSWEPTPGAAEYEIFIRNRNSGGTVAYEQGITGTSFTPNTPLPDGSYRWWAIAVSAASVRSYWTDPIDIHVGGQTDVLSPTGTTGDTTPTMTWRTVDEASRYELYVDRLGYTGGYIQDDNLTTTSYTPTVPLPLGDYRIWVRVVSTSNEFSPWSLPVVFSIADIGEQTDNRLSEICEPSLAAHFQRQSERKDSHDTAEQHLAVRNEMSRQPENKAADLRSNEVAQFSPGSLPQIDRLFAAENSHPFTYE